jgi:hypothetical protein
MAVVWETLPDIKLDPNAMGLAIGMPVRKTSPTQFWMHWKQALHPLNVKTCYITEQNELPAEARNKILEKALEVGVTHTIFLDDDILFPSITWYRLWVLAQQHPQAAMITGVYSTKLTPTEPLLYNADGNGAYWDWPLGVLAPIHSAGAGCMIVNMEYVKKLKAPWFNDITTLKDDPDGGPPIRHHYGHDRWFHQRLKNEAGGELYADTGLLLAHWDTDQQKAYFLSPQSPCFKRQPLGESYVPFIDEKRGLMWRRYVFGNEPDPQFLGYLDWLSKNQPSETVKMELLKNESDSVNPKVSVQSNDESLALMDWLRRAKGVELGSGDQPDSGSGESGHEAGSGDRHHVRHNGFSVADTRRFAG